MEHLAEKRIGIGMERKKTGKTKHTTTPVSLKYL